MRYQDLIPDVGKVALKRVAYSLYRVSQRVFQGPFNTYDMQTISVMRKVLRRDSNCVDVGANVGHILREMMRAAPEGRHMAFEPIPRLFAKLKSKLGRDVDVYNCALSSEAGQQTFYYFADSPALSGFERREKLGTHDVQSLTVDTVTLDSVWPADRPVALIKIDVEGAELAVLRGAMQTLRRNRPIVLFEWGLGGADEFGSTPEELADVFAECGLSVSLLEYFLAGREPLDRHEFCGQFYKHYNYFFIAYDATKLSATGGYGD